MYEQLLKQLDTAPSTEKIKLMDEVKQYITEPAVVDKICELLGGDDDRFVRIKATELLEEVNGNEKVVDALVKALKEDEDAFVRGFSAKALGRVGTPAAIQPLEEAVNDPDGFVRDFAAGSLKVLQMRARLLGMIKKKDG